MSHSPLLNLPGPPGELMADVKTAIADARAFVRDFQPDLTVVFAPDHYNGFFYRLMPPFCIGTAATGVGDYGTYAGPLNVPEQLAADCASAVLDHGVDVAVSACMEVDHGTVQPLEQLFADVAACPVIPVFINSVATPLGPIRRVRDLGAAIGAYLAGLDKRVLVLGSGGLSHDPPVPTLSTAPPDALDRIVHGRPMTTQQRQDRQRTVIRAAREFANGDSGLIPLNPEFDRRFLEIVDTGTLAAVDDWTNTFLAETAGNSAHEIRSWIAAFAALAAQGPYRTTVRYYRPAPELLAGFAIRSGVPA
ncbi:MAG TPA: 3-carboxyethylcatechol 2,3-dioxygenase [Mycolicibacillus parakoreensis]|uniref:2,3-dihydroxyphenylpropionate/2,3-dihydroxicinnamic acid 1,2-dioxygenase n=1 Tax=Mycolicibacillus parakoreensis TaxID=1069221 RepID=A0ABY3U3T2_9MYCO|nr:3-carboxyethylcatechol 2,3-dioxygenase [Mycolicibacillus parakoreensis]ULN54621.1 3-carboxyethylcatechol 2,3-dioxygenase [Mycolicibacillus parakoreensis]HLR98852.1 3-carboxyethylcatechol 2,3-dioxygenase [Mycolicibacillus parakoreensis]